MNGVISTYAYRMGGNSTMNLIPLLLAIVNVLLVALLVVAAIKVIQACNIYINQHKHDSDFKK